MVLGHGNGLTETKNIHKKIGIEKTVEEYEDDQWPRVLGCVTSKALT
jgi:hypothetical protein